MAKSYRIPEVSTTTSDLDGDHTGEYSAGNLSLIHYGQKLFSLSGGKRMYSWILPSTFEFETGQHFTDFPFQKF
jgi:hypothetical protein